MVFTQKWNIEPSVLCIFCYFKYSNQFLAHWRRRCQLQNKHEIYQNKYTKFLKEQHEYLCKQCNSLHSLVVNDSASKKALLTSFQIAHVLMKRKKFAKLNL